MDDSQLVTAALAISALFGFVIGLGLMLVVCTLIQGG